MIDFTFAISLPNHQFWKPITSRLTNLFGHFYFWSELFSTNDIIRIGLSLGKHDNSFSFGLFGFTLTGEIFKREGVK